MKQKNNLVLARILLIFFIGTRNETKKNNLVLARILLIFFNGTRNETKK